MLKNCLVVMACRILPLQNMAYDLTHDLPPPSQRAPVYFSSPAMNVAPASAALAGGVSGVMIMPPAERLTALSRMQQLAAAPAGKRPVAAAFQRNLVAGCHPYGTGALATSSLRNGLRFGTFCYARNFSSDRNLLAVDALAGAATGVLDALLFTPLERLRMIQLRNELNMPSAFRCSMTGQKVPLSASSASTWALALNVWRSSSSSKSFQTFLYRGWNVTLLKQSLMGAIAFGTLPLIPSDGQFSRGVCSGALAILFTHPLACIQSRMLAEQNATMTKIFLTLITEGGLASLLRGLWPRLTFGTLSWAMVLTIFNLSAPSIDSLANHVANGSADEERNAHHTARQTQTRAYLPVSGR